MTTHTTSRPRGQYPGPRGAWPPAPRARVLPPAPTTRQTRPTDLICDLIALLRSHGLDHLYWTATPTRGVLSVAYGITVWTNGLTLRCHTPTQVIHLPASIHTAARRLADLACHPPPPAGEARPCPSPSPTFHPVSQAASQASASEVPHGSWTGDPIGFSWKGTGTSARKREEIHS
jgi:hypothetical protein